MGTPYGTYSPTYLRSMYGFLLPFVRSEALPSASHSALPMDGMISHLLSPASPRRCWRLAGCCGSPNEAHRSSPGFPFCHGTFMMPAGAWYVPGYSRRVSPSDKGTKPFHSSSVLDRRFPRCRASNEMDIVGRLHRPRRSGLTSQVSMLGFVFIRPETSWSWAPRWYRLRREPVAQNRR